MLHAREQAALVVETRGEFCVFARIGECRDAHELDRDLLLVGTVGALAEVDHAHAAGIEFAHDAPGADAFAAVLVGRRTHARGVERGRRVEESAQGTFAIQQRAHARTHRVRCWLRSEPRLARNQRLFQRSFEQAQHLRVEFSIHVAFPRRRRHVAGRGRMHPADAV